MIFVSRYDTMAYMTSFVKGVNDYNYEIIDKERSCY